MDIRFTFHGHATLSFDFGGTKVLVDPFFTGNPLAKTKAEDVDADYILLTHGHGDHVGDVIAIAKRTGAKVIANFEIAEWVGAQGHEKVHPQHIGGGFNHLFGRVKMTTALHGSMLPDGSNGGMPGGFLLSVGDKNIYVAGDTGLFSDMSLIGNAGIDLAILPIGDNFTMGLDDSILAINYLKPKQVVPCHYNTWGYINVDVDAWANRVTSETDAEPIVLGADESLTLV